jgi:hypothetical protein
VPQVPDHVRRLRSLQPLLVPVRVRCALALRGRVGGCGTGRRSRFAHTVLVDMRERLRRSQRPDRIFEVGLQAAHAAGVVRRRRVLVQIDDAVPNWWPRYARR